MIREQRIKENSMKSRNDLLIKGKVMRFDLKISNAVLVFVSLFLFVPGCGDSDNTVIQPDSREPTAEESAEYENEIEEMNRERE